MCGIGNDGGGGAGDGGGGAGDGGGGCGYGGCVYDINFIFQQLSYDLLFSN